MKTFTKILCLLAVLSSAAFAQVTYNGRSIFTGTSAVSLCGTGAAMSTANSFNSGVVTVGSAASSINSQGAVVVGQVTNCTVTASAAFTNPQLIMISPYIKNVTYTIKRVSSTVFTVSFSTNMAGQQFAFLTF